MRIRTAVRLILDRGILIRRDSDGWKSETYVHVRSENAICRLNE